MWLKEIIKRSFKKKYLFGENKEKDMEILASRYEALNEFYVKKWYDFPEHPLIIKNEADYDKYSKLFYEFHYWKYKKYIKRVSSNVVLPFYDRVAWFDGDYVYMSALSWFKSDWNDVKELMYFEKNLSEFNHILLLPSLLSKNKYRFISKYLLFYYWFFINYSNDIKKHKQYKLYNLLYIPFKYYIKLYYRFFDKK